MSSRPEHYHTLDGKTAVQRRASLSAARATYQRRFGVEPPPGRVFRSGRAIYVAFPVLTHNGLTNRDICHCEARCEEL